MNADEFPPPDDEYTGLLASLDDALAAGEPVPETEAAPELRARLRRGLACLQMLDGLRPGREAPGGGPDEDTHPTLDAGEGGMPSRIGRFAIRRELGRGGFGVVFLAADPKLGREVALKVPHPQTLVTPELRRRFQYEARAAAGLDHPNLVPVYEAGEVGPVCYIASAYCPGATLAAWLKGRAAPVPAATAAAICAALARALEHAHGRGVLHRDVKPSNVLLAPGDGGGLGFVPRLTDFGLARSLAAPEGGGGGDGSDPDPTRTGMIVGTPSYMAPEQAGKAAGGVGPATDVYGLGAVLYELLTGGPPFVAESALDTLERVRRDEPVPPRRLRPRLPRDVETICLKCLEKDPRRRYATAGELAEDLGRFLEGRPIVARPVGRPERAWRWCLREPRVAGLLALLALVVVAGFGGVFWQWRRAEAQATLARAERDVARRERSRAEENFRRARAVVVRLSQLAEDLRHQPRLSKTRRLLLAEVSAFYEGLLTERSTDRGVRLEAARVCNRLAEVRHWLGQSDEEAEALRRGAELVDGLLAESPSDPAYRSERAVCHRRMGWYLSGLGKGQEAREAYEGAAAIDEGLVAEFPQNKGYRANFANDLMNVAELRRTYGSGGLARRDLLRAIGLQRALLAQEPSSFYYREELALSLDVLSRLSWAEGLSGEAESLCREALQLRQEVLEAQPEPAWNREFLARSQAVLAWMLGESGRHDEAEAMYRRRIATVESLVADYPDAPDYLTEQCRAWSDLGDLQATAGRTADAESSLARSLALFRKLAKDFAGTSTGNLKRQATRSIELSRLLRRLGREKEAVRLLDEALKSRPDDPAIQNELAWALATARDPEDRAPSRAVALAKEAVRSRLEMGNIWNTLGVAHYRAGDLPAAREALEKAMQLQSGGGGFDWIFLGMIHWKMGDREQARHWHDRAVRWIEQNRPTDEELRRFRAEAEALMAGGPAP